MANRITYGKVNLNTIKAPSGNPRNTVRRQQRHALKSYYASKSKAEAAKAKAKLSNPIELMGNANNAPGYYRFGKLTGGTRRRRITRNKKRRMTRRK